MPLVWLATCAELPTGGDESVLPDLFAAAGVDARWALWDDPAVDWASADLVAIRTTWDYAARLDEFLAWADRVSTQTRLVNAASVIRWNTDKRYLRELPGLGVPAVPTAVVADPSGLAAALAAYPEAIVKPAVGVGGIGVEIWRAGEPVPDQAVDVVVQPLVDSVYTVGEVSAFVMGGAAVAQVVKVPAAGEVRVHAEYGGVFSVQDVDPVVGSLAVGAIRAVEDLFSTPVPYGRVDLMWLDGQWVVGELEITEPSLYVAVAPHIASAYVEAITGLVRGTKEGWDAETASQPKPRRTHEVM